MRRPPMNVMNVEPRFARRLPIRTEISSNWACLTRRSRGGKLQRGARRADKQPRPLSHPGVSTNCSPFGRALPVVLLELMPRERARHGRQGRRPNSASARSASCSPRACSTSPSAEGAAEGRSWFGRPRLGATTLRSLLLPSAGSRKKEPGLRPGQFGKREVGNSKIRAAPRWRSMGLVILREILATAPQSSALWPIEAAALNRLRMFEERPARRNAGRNLREARIWTTDRNRGAE